MTAKSSATDGEGAKPPMFSLTLPTSPTTTTTTKMTTTPKVFTQLSEHRNEGELGYWKQTARSLVTVVVVVFVVVVVVIVIAVVVKA